MYDGHPEYSGIGDGCRFLLDVGFGRRLGTRRLLGDRGISSRAAKVQCLGSSIEIRSIIQTGFRALK